MLQFYEESHVCNVAALPFQAHANYGTWSWDLDFDQKYDINFGALSNVSLD